MYNITHRIAFRVWLGYCIQFFWKARPDYIFQRRWIYIGRLVSFEVASADLPTVLEEDRIASIILVRLGLISAHNLPKEYRTSGDTTWPALPARLRHFGASSVRQQGPAVRSQIYAEVYGNH